ncbi:peptide chain release factor N(5)-glutamine methyltransferase, partial [Ligilactobacillus salivarius]
IEGKKDIIVSNPPYISENEKIYMDKSVLNYEPHQALFAKNNGLEIYERIANESGKLLKQGSKIYMEIGFLQGKAVKKIFKDSFPNSEITLKKDINGNDRMICVKI